MIKAHYSIKGKDGTYSIQVFTKRKNVGCKEKNENFVIDFNQKMYTLENPNGKQVVENDIGEYFTLYKLNQTTLQEETAN